MLVCECKLQWCEVMELEMELASEGGKRDLRLAGFLKVNHVQPSSFSSQTIYKRIKMDDDMDAHQQEVDPLSDPEERRVLYSALDSFR